MKHLISKALQWYCTTASMVYTHEDIAATKRDSHK